MQIAIKENGEEVFLGQICEVEHYLKGETDTESLEFVGLDEYFYALFDELTSDILESAYTNSVTKSEVYKLKEQELSLFKTVSDAEKTKENFPLLSLSADREGVTINEIAVIIESKIDALKQLVSKLEDYKFELSKMKTTRLYEAKKSIYVRLSGELAQFAKKTFGIDVAPIEVDCVSDSFEDDADMDHDANNPNEIDLDQEFELTDLTNNSDEVSTELDEVIILDDKEIM